MRYLLLLILILPSSLTAQRNILNAKSPDEIGQKTIDELEIGADDAPLPYAYVNERDVLFSMTVWESIDLDERVNFPLYFPADTSIVRVERRPLIHYLLTNALDNNIDIYQTDILKDNLDLFNLNSSLRYRKIKAGRDEGIGEERIENEGGTRKGFLILDNVDLGEYTGIDETMLDDDEFAKFNAEMERLIFENNLLNPEDYDESVFDYADVIEYRIKGVWYFDKRQAELKYRPIAIAPYMLAPSQKAKLIDNPNEKVVPVPMFWMFYPDTRQVLFEAEAFNEVNTSKPVNFDHLINSRRFSAFIYKEDNVFQDRRLNEYIPENALMQLMESQRIKEKIRNKEQDMWSY